MNFGLLAVFGLIKAHSFTCLLLIFDWEKKKTKRTFSESYKSINLL